MSTIEHKGVCPACLSPNDAATDVHGTDATPQTDDLALCAYCGEIAMYVLTDNVLTIRKATDEEMESIRKDPNMHLAVALSEVIRG